MGEDYYSVLGVDRDSAYEIIKAAFHRLALEHHPDKSATVASATTFRAVHEAWKVLSDHITRAEYDRTLLEEESIGANAEKVDLVSFSLSGNIYSKSCRCGSSYTISEQDLADGYDLLQCEGCSLFITVVP